MPAENRDVRGNTIYPAEIDLSQFGGSLTDPSGKEHTGEIGSDPAVTWAAKDVNQSISTGTMTKVALDQTRSDTLGALDTANSKIVIPESGTYYVSGGVRYVGDANWTTGDQFDMRIVRNGSVDIFSIGRKVGTGDETAGIASAIRPMGEGNEIELHTQHNAGATVDINTYNRATFLIVARLS